MARRKRTNWFAVLVSVIALISLFAVAVFYIERETSVVIADEGYGDIVIIRSARRNENGSIDMGDRHTTILKNIDVFEHIYENEIVTITNKNFTELYVLDRDRETENTHIYKISKVNDATFIRVLVMNDEDFINFTTPQNVIIQSEDGNYSAQVNAIRADVYLALSRGAEDES